MRSPKPWFWKARNVWCVYINHQKYVLGPDKEVALDEFHNLMAKRRKLQRPSPKSSVFEAFLVWTKENRSAKTHRGYQDFCDSFRGYLAAEHPTVGIDDLSPAHVTEWLNTKPKWNATTKRNAITALQRAFNWGCKNMGLEKNPLKRMEKPEAKTRTTVLTDAEFMALLAAIKDRAFRELLIFSYDCGSRPQESKKLEARHFDLPKRRAVLPAEEAKGKKKARAIYIPTPRALKIVKLRIKEFPDGPVFRNKRGRPWTASAVKCRFANLETKLGKRYNQYAFRHTFITRKLIAGVDSHVVAALSGHSSSEMIDKVYSHVAEDHAFMLAAAKKGT